MMSKRSNGIIISVTLIGVAVVLMGTTLFAHPAAAHVLIRDESGRMGAVLHIMPDDDPIAGQSARLYFDVQGAVDPRTTTVTITDLATNEAARPVLEVARRTITTRYVFPTQGTYTITLRIGATESEHQSTTFVYTQRVSRGTAGKFIATATHPFARLILIMGGALMLVVLIVAFNRRREIMRYSRF